MHECPDIPAHWADDRDIDHAAPDRLFLPVLPETGQRLTFDATGMHAEPLPGFLKGLTGPVAWR